MRGGWGCESLGGNVMLVRASIQWAMLELIRYERNCTGAKERCFTVRESKGKTRLVPFRADLATSLERYSRDRDGVARAESTFLVRPDGRAYTAN